MLQAHFSLYTKPKRQIQGTFRSSAVAWNALRIRYVSPLFTQELPEKLNADEDSVPENIVEVSSSPVI